MSEQRDHSAGPGEPHQHVGPAGTVTCYAPHAEMPHDLVPREPCHSAGPREPRARSWQATKAELDQHEALRAATPREPIRDHYAATPREPETPPQTDADGLYQRAQTRGTPLLSKLADLSDSEWDELTHRMEKHFTREMERRGIVLVPASDIARDQEAEGHLIDQRDRAEDFADRLAALLAPFDVIGEHSNINNPRQNAIDHAEAAAAPGAALSGDMPDSLTVNGHLFAHVAACPCPRIQTEVLRLAEYAALGATPDPQAEPEK